MVLLTRTTVYKLIQPVVALTLAVMFASALLATETEKAKEFFNKGVTAQKEGKTQLAIENYKGTIAMDPSYYDAYINLGAMYFSQKQYDDALATLKKGTEKNPKGIDAFVNLAKVQTQLQKYVEAETSLKAAMALDPKRIDLYQELAKVYYTRGNYPEAINAVEQAHKAGVQDGNTWFILGKGYQKTDRANDAITALNKSLELDGKGATASQAWFAIGDINLNRQKYPEAAAAFKSALRLNSKLVRASYNFAVAMESFAPDSMSQNIANWEQYVRQAKGNPKEKNNVDIASGHIKELREKKAKMAGQ
jgi:tetratricopeptide (TPR) repeat protein